MEICSCQWHHSNPANSRRGSGCLIKLSLFLLKPQQCSSCTQRTWEVHSFTFHQIPSSHHGFRGHLHQVKPQHGHRVQRGTVVVEEWTAQGCIVPKGWAAFEDGSLVCLVEELLDVSLQVAGEEPPAVTLKRDAVLSDEELLEVPGHVVPADRAPEDELRIGHQRGRLVAGERELFPQVHEQRMSVIPIHVHLLQELELGLEAISRTNVLERQKDFFVLAVLLRGLITVALRAVEQMRSSLNKHYTLHQSKNNCCNVWVICKTSRAAAVNDYGRLPLIHYRNNKGA